MNFNTVQEAFNHYRNASMEDIETRAGQIRGTIENDPDADITKLNIEIEGLNQAKENIKDKEKQPIPNNKNKHAQNNPITGKKTKEKQNNQKKHKNQIINIK